MEENRKNRGFTFVGGAIIGIIIYKIIFDILLPMYVG